MSKKSSRQQISKRLAGKCWFCEENRYECLHAHRLLPGEEGGRYDPVNILVCCSNHHSMIHSGRIKILGWHPSTMARRIIHWIDEEGQEHWTAS